MEISPRTGFTNFYILVAVLIIGFLFVAYSIKRLKYSWKQVWKSVWICFLIALVLALVFSFVLSLFSRQVYVDAMRIDCGNPPCPMGGGDNTNIVFWILFAISLPVAFFIVWVIYYIVALIRN